MKKNYFVLFFLMASMQAATASPESQRCIQNVIDKRESDSPQLLLNNCKVEDDDLAYIFHILNQNPKINELYLDNNLISDAGAKQLAYLKIEYLSLGHNKITADGSNALAANESFKTLWLEENKLGDDSCSAFLNNKKLIELYLDNANITANGAKLLAQSNTLGYLSLDHNPIGDEGISAFTNSHNLYGFSANDTNITDVAANALASNVTIKYLQVGFNRITDVGAIAFAQADGPHDKYLYIAHNQLTAVGISALKNSPYYAKVGTDDGDWLKRKKFRHDKS